MSNIFIEAHGNNTGVKTFVPHGTFVHCYTDEGTMIATSHALAILANLPVLPEPRSTRLPDDEIVNHRLTNFPPAEVVARQQLIDRKCLDMVRLDLGGRSLCQDPARCATQGGGIHTCGGILDTLRGHTLHLLVCQGTGVDPKSPEHNEFLPPPDAVDKPGHTVASQALSWATWSNQPNVSREKVCAALLATALAEGNFAMCYLRREIDAQTFQPLNLSQGGRNTPEFRQTLDQLNGRLGEVEQWMVDFQSALDTDAKVDLVTRLGRRSATDLRYARLLDPGVDLVAESDDVAVATARSVLRDRGRMALLLHRESLAGRQKAALQREQDLRHEIILAKGELKRFRAGSHTHRLNKWLKLVPVDRAALRDLAWRSPDPELRTWLTETDAVLARVRNYQETFGGIGALHVASLPQNAPWLPLVRRHPTLGPALGEGETAVHELEAGITAGTAAAKWDTYSADARKLLTTLSETIRTWANTPDRRSAAARAAYERDGHLGLLHHLDDTGHHDDISADPDLLREYRRARSVVRAHDDVRADAHTDDLARDIAALLRLTDRERELLLRLSTGARLLTLRLRTFESDLDVACWRDTPTERLAYWNEHPNLRRVSPVARSTRVRESIARAELVLFDKIPEGQRLGGDALHRWYRDLASDQLREDVAAPDTRFGRKLTTFLRLRQDDDNPAETSTGTSTATGTTATSTTWTTNLLDALPDSTLGSLALATNPADDASVLVAALDEAPPGG